jgi:FkbM family methyltransferase
MKLAEKPFGELPIIGEALTALDPRFEHYSLHTVRGLMGEVGVSGVIDRMTDQLKLRKIDRLIEDFAGRQPAAFIVQVGAYDGRTNDHLFKHVDKNPHWSGIVVEPIHSSFQRLQKAYIDRPNVKPVRTAIHETLGVRTMFRVTDEAPESSRLRFLSTFERELLQSKTWMSEGATPPEIVEEEVDCTTLPRLFSEQGVDYVDIFEVDAEGLDALVLSQLDLDKYRPQFILFEHDNMKIEDLEFHLNRLEAAGYSFISMSVDTFCYLKN